MMHSLFFFMSSEAADILVPIAVAVVMPVLVVALVLRARQNETNRKAEVMIKAIESGRQIDPIFESRNDGKTLKERVLGKLTGACVTSCLGIGFLLISLLISFFGYGTGIWWNYMSLSLAGGVLLAVGIALFIVYFVSRKMLAKEIEAEEKKLTEGK